MNAGYLTALLFLVAFILLGTGWKPLLAPSISGGYAYGLLGAIGVALFLPIWLTPFGAFADIRLHVSVCLLLAITLYSWVAEQSGNRGYVLICALLIGIVWGCARSLYAQESMFYWLNPDFDAPLLAGLLCGAFVSDLKQQMILSAWGAALGKGVQVFFRDDHFQLSFGTMYDWDGIALAMVAACSLTVTLKILRQLKSKLEAAWFQLKGGKQP
ncbi:hypothetical protein ACFQZE_02620 [Paenibacillus sp. GCM10027627]|uniref:YphA family membrane protein n=1 Tax=unclassified Paenibacillus TaxID=185978 RepID=UPI003626EF9D